MDLSTAKPSVADIHLPLPRPLKPFTKFSHFLSSDGINLKHKLKVYRSFKGSPPSDIMHYGVIKYLPFIEA